MKISARTWIYVVLGVGVMGIGLRLLTDLSKPIILPFFPDVLDAIAIISAGILLMFEGQRHH